MWQANILTLFPEMFPGPLGCSLAGRALKEGLWNLKAVNIRDFAHDKHKTVDDSPFGGGAGMVMRPDIADAALKAVAIKDAPLVYLTPRGKPFSQRMAKELAAGNGVTFLCGRYEGVDQRVLEAHNMQEISLGDFVLSGGELAALTILDAVIRLLPGVIGKEESLYWESFEDDMLLEYPHYTRPQEWEGRLVPEVLVSGHHEKVRLWRKAQAEAVTRSRRPDLWATYIEKQARKEGLNP